MKLTPALAALALFVTALTNPAQAQAPAPAWPTKPITLVVNVPVGTSVDVVARLVSDRLSKSLGQAVVVDNRAGAAGNIGSEAVVRANPDGYTLLFSPASAITVNPFIYSKMRFDPLKDLVPVASAATVVSLLVTRPGLPVNNVAELVAHAKANPGKLTFGSAGAGSVPHLVGETFNSQAGVSTLHVPYRGGAQAMQDVMANQVDFIFDSGLAIAHVRAGKLKLLAMAMPKRSPLFPDTPTMNELGFKDFDGSTAFGFFAPAGTPAAIVNQLNAEVNRALAIPAVREQIAGIGADTTPLSPTEFRALLQAAAKSASALVKERNITVD